MQLLQSKLKSIVAFVLTLVGQGVAFYQANQNLTLKDVVMTVVTAVVVGTAVHQTKNKV